VARIIGNQGGNILQAAHHRTTLDAPVKGVELEIEIETRDGRHTNEIVKALNVAGYAAHSL